MSAVRYVLIVFERGKILLQNGIVQYTLHLVELIVGNTLEN